MEYRTLYAKTVADLRKIARQDGIKIPVGASKMRIVELILEGIKKKTNDISESEPAPSVISETSVPENEEQGDAQKAPKRRGRPPLSEEEKAERTKARSKAKAAEKTEGAIGTPKGDLPNTPENETETPETVIMAETAQNEEKKETETPKVETVPSFADSREEPLNTQTASQDSPEGDKKALKAGAEEKTEKPKTRASIKKTKTDAREKETLKSSVTGRKTRTVSKSRASEETVSNAFEPSDAKESDKPVRTKRTKKEAVTNEKPVLAENRETGISDGSGAADSNTPMDAPKEIPAAEPENQSSDTSDGKTPAEPQKADISSAQPSAEEEKPAEKARLDSETTEIAIAQTAETAIVVAEQKREIRKEMKTPARTFQRNQTATDNGAQPIKGTNSVLNSGTETPRDVKPNPRFYSRNQTASDNGVQPAAGYTARQMPKNTFGFENGNAQPTNGTAYNGRGMARNSTGYDGNAPQNGYSYNGYAKPEYASRGAVRNSPDTNGQPTNGYSYNGIARTESAPRGTYRNYSANDADSPISSANESRPRFVPKDSQRNDSAFDGADDANSSRADYPDINQQNSALSEMLQNPECPDGAGVLEIQQEGYGFLRAENFLPGSKDVYVSIAQIRRFGLRNGDFVEGKTRAQREGDRYVAMLYINSVNGRPPEEAYRRPRFEDLTPIYPDTRLRLEKKDGGTDLALRAIDLVAPIGKGQRGLIVSPPKAGKTVLLKKIANAITENYPDVHLIVLLIDERPEEVTDLQRSIQGEVVYSTFDEMPDNHTRLSEMTLDRAQRLVEGGRDVVILLDSITRLARAYNLVIPPTGRSLSGGLDPGALHKPKRFFGAARNIENGGSLTIIATALVETGSRMDDIIYEEFKGTGNMELHLDRKLSEKRIFPAVDLDRSGTRRDELLYDPGEAEGAMEMRRLLSSNGSQDNTEQFIELMAKTRTNAEFLSRMKGWVAVWQKEGFM